MLALAGLPLFFLECSLGQFASYGPTGVWRLMPLFKGVGVTMVVLSLFCTIYSNCIIAYSLFYLFSSFQSPLPWASCHEWWGADEDCTSDVNLTTAKNTSQTPGLQYWE
uniref:sodium- and chloride-dependent neutral and basic amino acid transporter B(0+)-like n=1 Tax=Myxine glutinosa TaxID=7769 RepID=UPI00358E8C00